MDVPPGTSARDGTWLGPKQVTKLCLGRSAQKNKHPGVRSEAMAEYRLGSDVVSRIGPL